MKKITVLTMLFLLLFVANCFAEDISEEKTLQLLEGIEGSQVWLDRNACLEMASIELDKGKKFLNTDKYNTYVKRSKEYSQMAQKFNHLDEFTLIIMDLDIHKIVLKKTDGTKLNIKVDSNAEVARLFAQGIILIDYPFSNNESEQEIYNIKNGKMQLGFTSWQAMLCWGTPNKKNKTTTVNGVHEEWVYNRDKQSLLYIDNDKVTGWKN